jgi:excisionase family DNA binding protein
MSRFGTPENEAFQTPQPVANAARGPLLTAQDVAEFLQVPVTWVYAETRAGRLPHVPLGRYRRYRLEALEQWLAERERGA